MICDPVVGEVKDRRCRSDRHDNRNMEEDLNEAFGHGFFQHVFVEDLFLDNDNGTITTIDNLRWLDMDINNGSALCESLC